MDGDAAVEPGGRGRLAGERVLGELVDVGGPPRVVDDACQRADDVVLVRPEVGVQAYEVFGDHLGHGPKIPPL